MKDIPELADVPVVVKQFSTRGDWSSTAYIHLDSRSLPKPAPVSENEPRTDLLLAWKDALAQFDQAWEVKWIPLTHGRDKRLWIRFGQLKEDPKDSNYQEKCRTHLLAWAKIRGYTVTNSYFNAGGVTLSIADRHSDWIPYTDHRAIVARVTHAIPNVSQETLQITLSDNEATNPVSRSR